MTTKTYPDYLPLPQISGYAFKHVSPFIRSEMITGRARQRRAYTSVPSMLSFTWEMTRGEAGLFEIWFKEVLTDGTEWFLFKLDSPAGFREYECRFSEMYEGPELIDWSHYTFSAVVEVKERPLIDKEWLDAPLFYKYSSIFDIAVNKEWPK